MALLVPGRGRHGLPEGALRVARALAGDKGWASLVKKDTWKVEPGGGHTFTRAS